jgi:FkbM family methyltransferase
MWDGSPVALLYDSPSARAPDDGILPEALEQIHRQPRTLPVAGIANHHAGHVMNSVSQAASALVAVENAFGQTMYVDPDDFIGRRIIEDGAYDLTSIRLMTALLERTHPRTALDIGANIGNHALVLARYCRRLIAMEPAGRSYRILCGNIAANPGLCIEAFNVAFSDADRTGTLFRDMAGNAGRHTLRAERSSEGAESEAVELHQGDRFLADRGITDVDVIKIDVEGHEAHVLLGLQRTLREYRPIVFMEWNDAEVRRRFREERLHARLLPDYRTFGIVSNRDRSYWAGKPWGRLRRRWRCWVHAKQACLTPFDSAATYRNVVMLPREHGALLEGLPWLD